MTYTCLVTPFLKTHETNNYFVITLCFAWFTKVAKFFFAKLEKKCMEWWKEEHAWKIFNFFFRFNHKVSIKCKHVSAVTEMKYVDF